MVLRAGPEVLRQAGRSVNRIRNRRHSYETNHHREGRGERVRQAGLHHPYAVRWDELNLVYPTRYELADRAMPMMAAGKRRAPEIRPDGIDLRDTAAFVWEIGG